MKRITWHLYFWVLLAIIAGGTFGYLDAADAVKLKPLGDGFITLAVVPTVPVAGLALILGIDRFMSEARALTNFIGNGVATVVVSTWEKELDHDTMKKTLNG